MRVAFSLSHRDRDHLLYENDESFLAGLIYAIDRKKGGLCILELEL